MKNLILMVIILVSLTACPVDSMLPEYTPEVTTTSTTIQQTPSILGSWQRDLSDSIKVYIETWTFYSTTAKCSIIDIDLHDGYDSSNTYWYDYEIISNNEILLDNNIESLEITEDYISINNSGYYWRI